MAQVAANGTVKLKLARSAASGIHLLEMRYEFVDHETTSAIEAELPRISGSMWIDRMYWQLVLPRDQHLLWSSSELTPEQTWTWGGLTWVRRATQEQPELEAWVGASASDPLPQATNRYLFSAMGSPAKFAARISARWEIVLVASATVLAIGLLLIYVPGVRRPSAVFVIGVVLAALGVWIPEAAILFAQAATLGFALVILTAVLQRWVTRRRQASVVVAGGRSSIVERSSARTKFAAAELAVTTTARAATMPAPTASSSHR
jgi:hypothetical protein